MNARMGELRGRVGGLSKRPPNDPELIAVRRELYVLTLAARIERAGPYTDDERKVLHLAVVTE